MANTRRPIVPAQNPNAEEHRRQLADRANAAVMKDGSDGMVRPLPLKSYAVADLPTASDWTNSIIYVSDEAGGATIAFSDGTNWRRVQDLAIVS